MAWQEVETDIGAGVGRPKYSVSYKHGGARLSIPKGTAERLGWTKETRLKLLVGGGESSGKLGRWPGLAPRDVDKIAVEIELDGSALVVTLPTHALAVPPAPRQPAGNGAGPTAGKRDVSDQFFNDPKRPPVGMTSGTRGSGR